MRCYGSALTQYNHGRQQLSDTVSGVQSKSTSTQHLQKDILWVSAISIRGMRT